MSSWKNTHSANDGNFEIGFMICFLLGLLGLSMGVNWYKAGIQAEIYQREGVEMTQWECFVGSKPTERTITIKGSK